MDLFHAIDWVGDDGVFKHAGQTIEIRKLGPDIYAVSEADDPQADDPDRQVLVGAAAVDYWLRTWIGGR